MSKADSTWDGRYPLPWGERLKELYGPYSVEHIRELGKRAGYDFNFSVIATNTFNSHRMLLWAEAKGSGVAYGKVLAKRYFEQAQQLGEASTLLEAAEEVGLPLEEAREVLTTRRFADEVKQRYEDAVQSGLTSIPLFILRGESGAAPPTSQLAGQLRSQHRGLVAVHGSASTREFESALERVMAEQASLVNGAEL